nr:hypothetical protein [Actinomycetales bacterium]
MSTAPTPEEQTDAARAARAARAAGAGAGERTAGAGAGERTAGAGAGERTAGGGAQASGAPPARREQPAPSRTSRALDLILAEGSLDGRLLHVERLAPRPAETAEWPEWADHDLIRGYRSLGIAQPWRH